MRDIYLDKIDRVGQSRLTKGQHKHEMILKPETKRDVNYTVIREVYTQANS